MKFLKARNIHLGRLGTAVVLIVSISSPLIISSTVFASAGGSDRGGGDIQCDALIKDLAGNLKDWLQKRGAETGKLDLSFSLNPNTKKPYTYSEYESQMLSLLAKPLEVSCVSKGDPGYPVEVDDSTKICASTVDLLGVHIVCDRGLFLGLSTDLQIEQNHHEFAIHIAGLEPDIGPISTYKISDQLSAYISNVVERRLVVQDNSLVGAKPIAADQIDSVKEAILMSLSKVPFLCNGLFQGDKSLKAVENAIEDMKTGEVSSTPLPSCANVIGPGGKPAGADSGGRGAVENYVDETDGQCTSADPEEFWSAGPDSGYDQFQPGQNLSYFHFQSDGENERAIVNVIVQNNDSSVIYAEYRPEKMIQQKVNIGTVADPNIETETLWIYSTVVDEDGKGTDVCAPGAFVNVGAGSD